MNDTDIKAAAAKKHPYQWWLENEYSSIEDWEDAHYASASAAAAGGGGDGAGTGGDAASGGGGGGDAYGHINHRLNMFGHTTETLDTMLLPMVVQRKDPLGSMGVDTPLAVLSTAPKVRLAGQLKVVALLRLLQWCRRDSR